MTNVGVYIVLSMLSFWFVADANCYPQGPCRSGFVDKSEGNYEESSLICDSYEDCDGGAYYSNVDCSCVCIESDGGCDSNEGLSGGAIAGIAIGAVCGLGLIMWIGFRCKGAEQPQGQAREVELVNVQEVQQEEAAVLDRMSSQQLTEYLTEFNAHGVASNGEIIVKPQEIEALDINANGWETATKGLPMDFTEFVRMKVKHPELNTFELPADWVTRFQTDNNYTLQ